MKKLIPFLALIFLISITLGQTLNTTSSFYNYTYDRDVIVKNKIEKIIIEQSVKDSLFSIMTYHFTKEGILEHSTCTSPSGKLLSEYHFKVDSLGNLTERQIVDHELNNKSTDVISRIYIEGRMIKESGALQSSREFSYNKKDLLEKIIFKSMGSTAITAYTYDNKNRMINSKEKRYLNEKDTIGNLFSNKNFIYDNKNQLLKEEEMIQDNSYFGNSGSTSYTYDNANNVVSIVRQRGVSQTIKYDSKGLMISVKETNTILDKNLVMEDKYSYAFCK